MSYSPTIILSLMIAFAPGNATPTRATTSADFALHGPTGSAAAVGEPFTITVSATFDAPLAACAFRLTATEGSVEITARTVVTGLRYLGTTPAEPLGSDLPHQLTEGNGVEDVLINLDTADPPGGPQDGLAPGSAVVLATYLARATKPGPLRITLTDARAVETQSAAGGALFESVNVDAGQNEVFLTINRSPDINSDGHVDLRDYAALQACATRPATGACLAADLDADGEIAPPDVARLTGCLHGPSEISPCAAPAPSSLAEGKVRS